jgi:hypothetical protein
MNQEILKVDYGGLVTAYWDNLNTTLRKFHPGAEVLDTWVPDDDHIKSILNLLEAAQLADQDNLEIFIDATIAGTIDESKLQEEVSEFGEVSLQEDSGGKSLKVFHILKWAEFLKLNPIYRKKIQKISQSITYEKSLEPQNGMKLITCSEEEESLMVLVDSDDIIREAAHRGTTSIIQKGVLDELCRIIIGLPMLELGDHGIILLENSIRDDSLKRPVAGIVLPHNADPIFRVPLLLTREILSQYRKAMRFSSTVNFYIAPAKSEWTQLSDDEQIEKLNNSLIEICEQFPFQASDIEVVKANKTGKVVIKMSDNVDKKKLPEYLMQLEKAIQEKVEPTLRLYFEERKDDSTLRRL